MDEDDVGSEMLSRLRESVGPEAGWTEQKTGYQWSLWGAVQHAWSEPSTDSEGWPTWRLQLRTPALEGFTGSAAQLDALSAEPPVAALAGLVRNPGQPAQVELASSIDVLGNGISWVLWMLTVAGRFQAAEARRLSASGPLASVGLRPAVSLQAEAPSDPLRPEQVLVGAAPPARRVQATEMSECVDALRAHAQATAATTSSGLTARFTAGATDAAESRLEVKTDAQHPLLGTGISAELRTSVRDGMLRALALNEREVGPRRRGDALGGWWAAETGLVHGCFHPSAFHPSGFGVELVLAYARRAREVHETAAGRH